MIICPFWVKSSDDISKKKILFVISFVPNFFGILQHWLIVVVLVYHLSS